MISLDTPHCVRVAVGASRLSTRSAGESLSEDFDFRSLSETELSDRNFRVLLCFAMPLRDLVEEILALTAHFALPKK